MRPNSVKIRSVGAELFHAEGQADGRTDGYTGRHYKVAFRNFERKKSVSV